MPVDALTIGVTFFLTLDVQPGLLSAMVLGITVASLGATIIKIAEVRGRKALDALLSGGSGPQPAA